MIPMENGNDPVKAALNNLIKAMYGRMDYSDGSEELADGAIEEAMDPESEMEMDQGASYDPIAEGDAQPQASLEEEGIGDEVSEFFKGRPNPDAGKKSITMMQVSQKPMKKKKTRGKNYRKKDL